jgi:hypothetical protein
MSTVIADIVMIVHSFLIIGVLLGILISARYKRYRPFETIILLGAIIIWSLYSGCPLTYLEVWLREDSENSTALLEAGFIPYYFEHWFGLSISRTQLIIATYSTAAIFLALSIEWMSPWINFEIIKFRRLLKRR